MSWFKHSRPYFIIAVYEIVHKIDPFTCHLSDNLRWIEHGAYAENVPGLDRASANQQERRNFLVAWHKFSLPGRWAWFYRAFESKSSSAERIEIGTERAMVVSDATTHPVRVS